MLFLSRHVKFKKKSMLIGKSRMSVFIADTLLKMTVGLMFREKLRRNECMLFAFPRDGPHPIWTRHMRFPIDIVWCDAEGRVVDFMQSVAPAGRLKFSGYYPRERARYVLEFNSGFVKRNGIKIREKIIFKSA
ncbi:MAG: DUF192 domain-containing protein [Candidatus Micrarchaeales archaeon]|nr:DUF192 domain-containing protein [Candidatus Micrarchaeales archaeon]